MVNNEQDFSFFLAGRAGVEMPFFLEEEEEQITAVWQTAAK